MTESSVGSDRLGPEVYRALYENSPDGVLFSVPGGRVIAANPAACKIFAVTEAEICTAGRQGWADPTDECWAVDKVSSSCLPPLAG